MRFFVVFLFFPAAAFATTIHVPADFPTIQEGINNAVDGDTVRVADGTYTGESNRDIDFLGKAIVVRSENGPKVTVIDCEGSEDDPHRGFYFQSDETNLSIVEGFTIMNGCTSISGGGICCEYSSPTIQKCVIIGNTASAAGGGICLHSSSAVINDCFIMQNQSYRFSGGGIWCYGMKPIIHNCVISHNHTEYSGGGIDCHSDAVISDCLITYNTSVDTVDGGGGGIHVYSSNPIITNCTITRNDASDSAWEGAILIFRESYPTITNCVVWNTPSMKNSLLS